MHKSRSARLGAVALVGALLLAVCASGDDDADDAADEAAEPSEPAGSSEPVVYPGADWVVADPEDLGFDPATLEDLAAEAEAEDSNCVIVTRHGQVAGEWYWQDTGATSVQEVYSATKSYASTLVGIAQAEGLLDIDDKASKYIPEWMGTPSEDVTIKNLLSNDSGRQWDFEGDFLGLSGAPSWTAYAIARGQQADPGTEWVYNNSAIQTLDAILRKVTGRNTNEYAQEKLLGPIGMTSSHLKRNAVGDTGLYYGLQSTCRDMARFGYLFLRDGDWDGTEVVPEDWVAEATQPSQDIFTGYGYLWWLNTPAKELAELEPMTAAQAAERPDREPPPGSAETMYWALGLGGQIIQVDPDSDTVVVRLGPFNPQSDYGPEETVQFVTELRN